ncbi:MAG: glycosyltransferase involved in cell wall biosynthesis, partial [Psychroserpens sp.]
MKLSIITINFNNAVGLKKTIESVVNQTSNDFEYIVIDGGSNDGSVDVIKEYEAKVSYWVSEVDKGIYHAMNKGILLAKGDYLEFLNSGDILVNETVIQKIIPELNVGVEIL